MPHNMRSALLILFILACGQSTSAESPKPEFKLGHIDPKGSLYWTATEEFKKRVNEKLAGHGAVNVYRAGELGTEKEMLAQLQRGETSMALVGQVMPSINNEFAVFELPYLVLSRAHIRKVRQTLLAKYLRPAALKKGFRILAMWEAGFRYVTNNVHPIESPADLKGLRIAVDPGRKDEAVFSAFGALPKPVNLDATYMLLKHGEIDAEQNSMNVISNRRLYEVQKYLSLTRHNYMPAYLLVSEDYFLKLDPVVKKVLSETAEEMQDWVLDQGDALDRKLLQDLSPRMAVNQIDTLAFVMQSIPIYQDFAKSSLGNRQLIKLLFDNASLLTVDRQ